MSRIQKSKLMLNRSVLGLFLIQLHRVKHNFITTYLQVGNIACTSHNNTVIWYVVQNLIQPPASFLWTLNILLNRPQHPTWLLPVPEQQQHFRFPQLNSSQNLNRKKKKKATFVKFIIHSSGNGMSIWQKNHQKGTRIKETSCSPDASLVSQ